MDANNTFKLIDTADRRDLTTGRYLHVAVVAILADTRDENDEFGFADMALLPGKGQGFKTRDEQLANRAKRKGGA